MLADSFGRIATDLRVSLTDRCNLRCAYCMPPEGLDWLPTTDQLTDDEVVRLRRDGGRGVAAPPPGNPPAPHRHRPGARRRDAARRRPRPCQRVARHAAARDVP